MNKGAQEKISCARLPNQKSNIQNFYGAKVLINFEYSKKASK